MHIYCDESGNTGVDLLNADQPLFALASTSLDEYVCRSLIAPLLRQGQQEAKYTRLKGTSRGQQALLSFFSSESLSSATTKLMLVDKRFYAITHLVDKLIEPPLFEAGHDLYAGDAHVGLVNVWYFAGRTIFPGHWDRVLSAFVLALRQRNSTAYADFDRVLRTAAATTPHEDRDLATGLLLAHGRLPELLGAFHGMVVFDPAVDMFIALMHKWMEQHPGMLQVTHDRSKPLKNSESFLRKMMTPLAPRIIGYGQRQVELPLRVAQFDFGDSIVHPQLQVADIVAGAAIDCWRAGTNGRPRSEYHEQLRESRLLDLLVDGMLPNPNIERQNEPEPGQVSLVDGSAAFMADAEAYRKEGDRAGNSE